MTASWLSTLDAFSCYLDVQAEQVEDGRYDEVVAFVPPAHLPSLPTILVPRALVLLDRARTLTGLAEGMRSETAGRLALSRRPGFAQRSVSAYVDQQA